MDFGTLLHVAKKNSNAGDNDKVRCYSTKFAPPKKEQPKDKKLSANIQKFLQKREEEEREKERIAKEKRDQLLAMRDNKSKNKINKMLKVIKSANKAAIDDAVDRNNTAVTMQGPEQPDEDDYGYVSQESCALYRRLMDKYGTATESNKGGPKRPPTAASAVALKSAHDRVKSALKSQSTASGNSHSGSSSSSSNGLNKSSRAVVAGATSKVGPIEGGGAGTTNKTQVARRPPSGPPPVDFHSLLKLAEKKQFEPIKVVEEVKKEERPMTMKEKREQEERQRLANERKKRLECDNYDYGKKGGGQPEAGPSKQVPPGNNNSNSNNNNNNNKLGAKSDGPGPAATKGNAMGKRPAPAEANRSKAGAAPTVISTEQRQQQQRPPTIASAKGAPGIKGRPPQPVPERTRQFPPPDVQQRTRQFPPPDVQRARGPPGGGSGMRPDRRRISYDDDEGRAIRRPMTASAKRARIEDDYSDDEEEDYDSEMDDFIDDGPEDESNVSGYIKEIFGYDKRRFRDEDFDDREMESSFAQQMREEYISKKIGIMEDLEDMRQEEIDKAKKVAAKKKMAKGR